MSDESRSTTEEDKKKKAAPKRRRRKDDELAQQEPLSDEEMNAPGRKWYFVHTYSGHENKVRNAIRSTVEQMDANDKIFNVVVPTEDEIEIRDGQRRTVKRKLYPGYVLVQTIELQEGDPPSDEAWHIIRNTSGVTGFVSSGTRPVPLSPDEVAHILRAMRMEQPRVRVGFQVGQNVRITDGPFEDLVGAVDEINMEKGKVRVLVSMLGRETPVELDFLQVEKLSPDPGCSLRPRFALATRCCPQQLPLEFLRVDVHRNVPGSSARQVSCTVRRPQYCRQHNDIQTCFNERSAFRWREVHVRRQHDRRTVAAGQRVPTRYVQVLQSS
ncbi:MAG: transcription termination/antitermination protein NusG [Dehalococcoidia bacterium]|nr:transcription termination/antitermination protein NusG [Dehalococcoidia bacterium]